MDVKESGGKVFWDFFKELGDLPFSDWSPDLIAFARKIAGKGEPSYEEGIEYIKEFFQAVDKDIVSSGSGVGRFVMAYLIPAEFFNVVLVDILAYYRGASDTVSKKIDELNSSIAELVRRGQEAHATEIERLKANLEVQRRRADQIQSMMSNFYSRYEENVDALSVFVSLHHETVQRLLPSLA